MSNELTVEKLRKIVDLMMPNAIKPRVVESAEQARAMSENSPTGKVWAVGEKYYLCSIDGLIP